MSASEDHRLLLTAGQLIDGAGDEPVRDAMVMIDNGRIKAVGRADDFGQLGQDLPRYDFPAGTMLPGLIDVHTHLVLWGDGGIPFASIQQEPDEQLLLRAAHNANTALKRGVTTLADLGTRGTITFALRRGIEAGYVSGPRLVLAGRPITATGGHCWYFGGEADGVEAIRHLIRQLVKDGSDLIKVMATGGGTVGTNAYRTYFSLTELRTIVEEAHRAGLPAAAHCTSLGGLIQALDAGFDTLVHATFHREDGSFFFDQRTAERIVARGAYLNPTMHVSRTRIWGYRQRHPEMNEHERAELGAIEAYYAAKVDAISRLRQMGAKIVAGSDAGWADYRFGDFQLELEAMAEAGFSAMELIQTATSTAAACLRVADRTATIETGKEADILIVDGDPLQDPRALSSIAAVVRGGELVGEQRVPAVIPAMA
ncbi:MAG: amidohydrolase family protein [Chloroflexota bacterium]|nr:amidohydrolase family protein [Chloroflexota bacterium]